jgi:hypothetical protein
MAHSVTVAFGSGREFAFTVEDAALADLTDDQAWRWFDREYAELDCQPTGPVGKVLVIDKVLSVAKFAGERRFDSDAAWAQAYAAHAARLLDRDTVRVDVGNAAIGF